MGTFASNCVSTFTTDQIGIAYSKTGLFPADPSAGGTATVTFLWDSVSGLFHIVWSKGAVNPACWAVQQTFDGITWNYFDMFDGTRRTINPTTELDLGGWFRVYAGDGPFGFGNPGNRISDYSVVQPPLMSASQGNIHWDWSQPNDPDSWLLETGDDIFDSGDGRGFPQPDCNFSTLTTKTGDQRNAGPGDVDEGAWCFATPFIGAVPLSVRPQYASAFSL